MKGITEKIILSGQQGVGCGAGGEIGDGGLQCRGDEFGDVAVAGIVGVDTVGAQVAPGEGAGEKFRIHCVVVADHGYVVVGADPAFQQPGFINQACTVKGIAQGDQQSVQVKGFLKKIVSPQPCCFNSCFHRAMPRHHNDGAKLRTFSNPFF